MKSTRRASSFGQQQQHSKKFGKSSDKWPSRLDRKSSRGMIYENEELRLRTININAEVERGQSDIRKLRKENEQLRREIWTLRDEYDRLNKLLRQNKNTETNCDNDDCSGSQTDDSNSCDEQRDYDNSDDEKSSDHQQQPQPNSRPPSPMYSSSYSKSNSRSSRSNKKNKISVKQAKNQHSSLTDDYGDDDDDDGEFNDKNVDHLSIVSEENLTNNSDGGGGGANDGDQLGSHIIPTGIGIGNPYGQIIYNKSLKLTEPRQLLVENEPTSASIIPPLSHFENLIDESYSQNCDDRGSALTNSTTASGETVIAAANCWDFNIQSPFCQQKFVPKSNNPKNYNNNVSTNSIITSFQSPAPLSSPTSSGAVTTTSSSSPGDCSLSNSQSLKSPKHFFSPIKPQQRFKAIEAKVTELPTLATSQGLKNKLAGTTGITTERIASAAAGLNKPDICVANVLSSPYGFHSPPIPQPTSSAPQGSAPFSNGGNLEELLYDIDSLSTDLRSIKVQQQKSSANSLNKSFDNLSTSQNNPAKTQNYNESQSDLVKMNPKPYKSEMNLVLNYIDDAVAPGDPMITPILDNLNKIQHSTSEYDLTLDKWNPILLRGNTYDSSYSYTPPPQINYPEPMTLISRLGFEKNYDMSPNVEEFPANSILLENHAVKSPTATTIPSRLIKSTNGLPTILPAIQLRRPYELNGISNSPVLKKQTAPAIATIRSSPAIVRRKQFSGKRSDDTPADSGSSFNNTQSPPRSRAALDSSNLVENLNCESSSGSESQNQQQHQKSGCVSILKSPSAKKKSPSLSSNSKLNELCGVANLPTAKEARIVCVPSTEETLVFANNTPNPLHSDFNDQHYDPPRNRRSSISQHIQNRKTIKDSKAGKNNISGSKTSLTGGNTSGGSSGTSAIHQNLQQQQQQQQQQKLGSGNTGNRRYSEAIMSTTSSSNQDHSNQSNHSNHNHSSHHHHHHHHHNRRSSALIDPNHESGGGCGGAGTSISDRNSNSLASSGDSSTNLSIRSQRRKISINSHNGSKIPWCGCWGNGCL